MKKIINQYNQARRKIADIFCNKYEVEIEYELPGGAGYMVADYCIALEDMITCLENNYTFNQFLQWYDYALDIGMRNGNNNFKDKDEHIINLYNYTNHYIKRCNICDKIIKKK